MRYNSIVPSEMTDKELQVAMGHLFVAKSWGLTDVNVSLTSGLDYKLPVDRWADYNEEFNKR